MDRPILHPFVQELRESERLRAFAEAFPAAARVSEPALPLLLAALHEELERPLVLLAPEDADARDLAEAVAWFIGDERVALLPSRGVHWESGLEPAPHLVGERARALDVLARGGLVCASASALAEGLPREELRPDPIRIAPGEEVSLEQLSESLAQLHLVVGGHVGLHGRRAQAAAVDTEHAAAGGLRLFLERRLRLGHLELGASAVGLLPALRGAFGRRRGLRVGLVGLRRRGLDV